MAALKTQGISRDTLPYKAPFQPYGAYWAIGMTALVAITKGYDSIVGKFNHTSFITNYIALPAFVIMFVGYKVMYKTKKIRAEDIDLVSGKREIDEDEAEYVAEVEAREGGKKKGVMSRFKDWWNN